MTHFKWSTIRENPKPSKSRDRLNRQLMNEATQWSRDGSFVPSCPIKSPLTTVHRESICVRWGTTGEDLLERDTIWQLRSHVEFNSIKTKLVKRSMMRSVSCE